MCWKTRMVKTTVFFIFDQLLGALYLNLFLIDDPLCKLCNIWLLLCENNSRSITIPDLNTGGKYCCSYYQDQVIDDNLERQIKNRTFCTCRLFPLTQIFQYISNWSKALWFLPTLFVPYTQRASQSIKLPIVSWQTIFQLIRQVYI